MTEPINSAVPKARDIVLDADGVQLSALLAEPEHLPPRAVVVAVPGGGMKGGYFHGPAHPSLSLLALGARLGFTVLAVDRPGYGLSASQLPEGMGLAEQSATLHAALGDFALRHQIGAGFFLVAHSYGGKLALTAAADNRGAELIGMDISGVSHRYAVDVSQLLDGEGPLNGVRHGALNWGPLRLYPPDTFRLAEPLVSPMPVREAKEIWRWPEVFPSVAARLRVPVRFTFAEHERWWRHDEETLSAMRDLLAAPKVLFAQHPHAGHNISLGWAARSYHLKALAFAEECLLTRQLGAWGQGPR
ncbi:alpha/beta hydrolase [Streptantibioticus rubrisoli]|uniref:Lysophospholipase n=1 Tax=Streptantibioticus rubrisoli TaxID=1387313 RepID=A0ABT1P9L1_9ACTN|nr:alpha/beta hydrolase [Streptantibioticus rubrisoli]MCQ4042056.1 lysophospholipase [Streptantibioticus rubrisoli]